MFWQKTIAQNSFWDNLTYIKGRKGVSNNNNNNNNNSNNNNNNNKSF